MSLRVDPVDGRRDLAAFVELPFCLYSADPFWVPPLRSDVRWVLDPGKNPFWNHARRRLFLARRDGRVVGRVAGIVDDEHNRVHSDRTAFFGFFEAENDPEVATALLDAAEAFVRAELPGCDSLRGPVNPSMNDEAGALVPAESEPGPPYLMMTYNPAYYLDLFQAAGFLKEKDLLAIKAPVDGTSLGRLQKLSERVRRREPTLVSRHIRMEKFGEELAHVKAIYNGAWEQNWGFVPMTSAELDAMGARLKPLVNPRWVTFAELDGKTAAFLLALPDYNQVLIRMGGSLFPFGWLTFLRQKKRIDQVRVLALGVLPEFRRRGLDAILYQMAVEEGMRLKYRWAEFSWLLEDNEGILSPLRVFGGHVYRRYRILSRPVREPGRGRGVEPAGAPGRSAGE